MKYKDGVIMTITKVVDGEFTTLTMTEEAMDAMLKADKISLEVSGKEMVVTSILDGVHKQSSKHYVGDAFDMRVWIYTKSQLEKIITRLKKDLGKNYFVLFEGDHIHVQFDPK